MVQPKRVFLLGGNDLEMETIKQLLQEKEENFEDKDLTWGAKLSDYQEFLGVQGKIYGIELEADITPPKNYVEIDHHGKNDSKPSSLEQVAEILNVELSREQELIAANDSKYISGMKAMCATKEEIDDIRKRDRISQGVTQEDEELAKKSFDASCEMNTNIIFSYTPKFTPVSDLAYGKFDNYVIYNDTQVVFYSYKKGNILEFLKSQNINESDYYHGGGDFGFVGIKENMIDKEKIKSLIEEFKTEDTKVDLYSYHTFMLPFTFEGSFEHRDNWKHKVFKIKQQRDYNEYVYFYKHIQDAIYNLKTEEDKRISEYYEYKTQKGTYTIDCKKGIFELELDGLSLRIFNTNIGILSFNLKNKKYSDEDSVLAINDFGRRIYPQFLGEKFTCDTKNAILSNNIILMLDHDIIKEDFKRFDKIEEFKDLEKLNLLPKFISKLIEENFKGSNKIRPIIDDRMFVMSQYMNDDLVSKLKRYDNYSNQYQYEKDDFWYKYIFVDGDDKTCQSKNMTKKLINESTYDRWVEWGTLFGVSRYSFAVITGSWYGKNRLLPHMQTMYFQMFTLLLTYRATIIKFTNDIQDAAANDNANNIIHGAKKVYKNYLDFLNNLYFNEVTAQEQGIELYNQAMKLMSIDKYMSDLDSEINELHNYAQMLAEKSRNEKLEFISKIGAILLPPSLLAGIFGMNVLTFEGTLFNETFALLLIVLSGFLGFVFTRNDEITSKEKNTETSVWKKFKECFSKPKRALTLVFIIFVILFAIFIIDTKNDEPQNVNIINQPTVILKTN